MKAQFQRILDLVRRTGDRMVVTDPDGEHAYVVMDLDQYEDLLVGNEASLTDFAANANEMDEEDFVEPSVQDLESEIPQDIQKAVEQDLAIIQSWEQAHEKEKVEQIKKKDDGGTDEERFYLEPIE